MCTGYRKQLSRSKRRPQGCSADLTELIAPAAPEELLYAIDLLHPGTDPAQQVKLCAGQHITKEHASAAVQLLANENRHDIRGQRIPTDRTDLEDALMKAGSILSQPSMEEAAAKADEHRLLRVQGRLAPIAPGFALQRAPLDPLLHAIRLRSLHDKLPPSTQLAFRIGSDWPRIPHQLRHEKTRTPEHVPSWDIPPAPMAAIPQLWWPHGLPGFDLTGDEQAQFAISIAITCVGRSITVASAAELLGAPKRASAKVVSTWRRVAQQSGWPNLRHALLATADRLTRDPPPIDYAARRRNLASPQQLNRLLQRKTTRTVFSDSEQLWIWCHFTRSSPRLTPDNWEEVRAPQTHPSPPAGWKVQRLQKTVTAHLNEPETWEPP